MWRGTESSVAERCSGAVATLVLRGRRGAPINGGRGINGVRGRPGAVEALRDAMLVVDSGYDGGGAGCVCKRMGRGQAVKGIGRVCCGSHHLAKGEAYVGARRFDGRAQRRVLEEWRGGRVELDAGSQGRAHHPGVVWSKRHRFLQDSRGEGWRQLRDMSTCHGKRLPGRDGECSWLGWACIARSK
jgi:hypothetical protein